MRPVGAGATLALPREHAGGAGLHVMGVVTLRIGALVLAQAVWSARRQAQVRPVMRS